MPKVGRETNSGRSPQLGWLRVRPYEPPWAWPPAATSSPGFGTLNVLEILCGDPGGPPPGTVKMGSRALLQPVARTQYGVTGARFERVSIVAAYSMYALSVLFVWFMSIQPLHQRSCLWMR